jgi:hypothetical protein
MSLNFTDAQIQLLREVGAEVKGPPIIADEVSRDGRVGV